MKKRDFHSIVNAITGAAIALVAAIYFKQIPVPLIIVLLIASNILVLREIWMMGGRLVGTTNPN